MKLVVPTIVLMASAVAALAHSGVKNAQVMQRMDSMKTSGDAMKTLGAMARGKIAFDQSAARAAAAVVATEAARTEPLFTPREQDPNSEARPEIWQNFEDFAAKAAALEVLAREYSTSIETADDLAPALVELGAACKSCHSLYRE